MKIVCSKENLLSGVQVVQRAVSSKNPLPILSGILIQTHEKGLKLAATDLEIGIECIIPVTVIEAGEVVLPAKYFSEIVRKLPDVKIEIETNQENNSTIIKYAQSEFNINGFSAAEFPMLPQIEGIYNYHVKADLLKNMIRQVIFATSNDENRPIFTGVLFELEEQELKLVTTDTHRLAFRRASLNNSNDQGCQFIIPGKTLNELSRIISSEEENISINFNESQVLFESSNISLVSRLIEGQYPNYRQVIPSGHTSVIRIKTRELQESVERASLLADIGNNVIKIQVEQEKMVINSTAVEIGRVHEEIAIYLEGEVTNISFNARYLMDVLKVVDAEEINIELTGSLSPGIIKPVSNDNYLYLLLPVRTV